MRAMHLVDGVLFDMDGTLLDTERVHDMSWRKALASKGKPFSKEFQERTMGTNVANVKFVCNDLFGLDGEEMVALEVQLTLEHLKQNGVPVMPGVPELLPLLRKEGIKTCVCTSTNRADAQKWLAWAGLLEQFDGLVCGDEVSASKPAPDIFLRGAAVLGIPIERCLVIEDSKNGLLAGLSSGAKVMRVEGTRPIEDEITKKAPLLRHFGELPGLIL